MGFFRTLYRETRDILGLKPPSENDAQRAERVCDEVKGDLGGKKSRRGDDWVLVAQVGDRSVEICFEVAGGRALMTIASELGDGPHFKLLVDSSDSIPPGRSRRSVGTALYLDAPDEGTLDTFETMWKALPTGTRGNLSSQIQKSSATFVFSGTTFNFVPEVAVFTTPGARSQIRGQAQLFARLVAEMEDAWQAL